MSLFNTYSDANKVVTAGRNVRYSSTPEFWTGNNVTVRLPIYWTLTRRSTMAFSYIGMARSTAEQCAKELQTAYTRKYMRWTATVVENEGQAPTVLINQDRVFELTSSIAPSPIAGDDWQVTASIDETDTIITDHEVTDIAEIESLFQVAEQRESSSSGGSLAIASAKWSSSTGYITAEYSAIIPNFNSSNLRIQIKENGVWGEAFRPSEATSTAVSFQSATNATFRLAYNGTDIVSTEWTTTNVNEPTFVITSAKYTRYKSTAAHEVGWPWLTKLEAKFDAAGMYVASRNIKLNMKHAGYYFEPAKNSVLSSLGSGSYVITGGPVDDVITDGTATVYVSQTDLGLATSAIAPTDGSRIFVTNFHHIGSGSTAGTLRFSMDVTTDLPSADVISSMAVALATTLQTDPTGANVSVVNAGTGVYNVSVDLSVSSETSLQPYVSITSGGTAYLSTPKRFAYTPPVVSITSVTDGPAGREINFVCTAESFNPALLQVEKMNVVENPTISRVPSTWTTVATTSVTNGKAYTSETQDAIFRVVYNGTPSAPFVPSGWRCVDLRSLTNTGTKLVADVTPYGENSSNAYLLSFVSGQYDITIGELTRNGSVFEIATPTRGETYCIVFRYNANEWCSSVALAPTSED